MSSPLDGRIRTIAREEAAALLGTGGPDTTASNGQDVQQQLTDLHEHLHMAATTIKRLEARIDALEKAAGQPDPKTPTVRRTRKAAESE